MPGMLPDYELAQIQADAAAAACDLPCQIERASPTWNASGGADLTWQVIASVLVGMAEPTASQLENYGYLIGTLAAWQIRLPFGTNVLEQDRLIINGETLLVHKVMQPRSYTALLTVLAAEVK